MPPHALEGSYIQVPLTLPSDVMLGYLGKVNELGIHLFFLAGSWQFNSILFRVEFSHIGVLARTWT